MANGIFRSTTIRVDDAASFVTSFYSAANYLYALIGREDNPVGNDLNGNPYASQAGLWTNDAIPPLPDDTGYNDRLFWSMAIGGQLIDPKNICLVVPRNPTTNWTSGTVYDKYDDSNAALYVNNNFYIVNSANEVLLCVQRGGSGSGPSTIEPQWYQTFLGSGSSTLARDQSSGSGNVKVFGDTTQSIVKTTDGYIWKYLYTLTPYAVTNLMQSNWLPVNFGNIRWGQPGTGSGTTSDDKAANSQDYITTSGSNGYAYKILGARYALITVTLTAGLSGSGLLPAGLDYRQVAFVKNPQDLASVATPKARASFAVGIEPNSVIPTGGTGGAGQFVVPSGDVIYIENKSPITRSTTQSEIVKTVISF